MATEIERKFLVKTDVWRPSRDGTRIRQGYLRADERCTIRVRIADGRATLAIKATQTTLTRHEFEYEIARKDAEVILAQLCGPVVEKTRYQETVDSHAWVIDVFHGDNAGLVVAEIEIDSEDEPFVSPPWLGREVSDDSRYSNARLATRPYSTFRST